MNTENFSKDIIDRISVLKEEYRKLILGEEIDIVLTFDKGVKLYWEDGDEFTEVDGVGSDYMFWDAVSKQYEEQMKTRREVFQARINAVCSNSDKLADELGIDHQLFFETYIMC